MQISGRRSFLAVVLGTLLSFVGCEQSKPAPSVAAPGAPSTEKVYVVFDGPWAFAADPQDASSVLAIAPRSKGHRELYVKASNQSTLLAGRYDLTFPAHTGPAAATADPDIAQARIDSKSLQQALDNKFARYVIRLPKPEEYVIASRSRSRLGATYPPEASSEKDYATAVALRYDVTTKTGFSLAGVSDSAPFDTLPLRVETPALHFVIEPMQDDDPKDKCDTHSREAFRDLASLLGLKLYVDFADNPAACHAKDPQRMSPAKAEIDGSRLGVLFAMLSGNLVDANASASAGDPLVGYFASAIYFFTHPSGDCHAPDLILTTGP